MSVVVDQRTLGDERVARRTTEHAARSAGRIGIGERQSTVVGPPIGDDMIAAGVVGLHEHDVVSATSAPIAIGQRRRPGDTAKRQQSGEDCHQYAGQSSSWTHAPCLPLRRQFGM
jgi:hypothetical protein